MKNLPVAKSDIERLQSQCRHYNIFPIFLPHYYPSPKKNHPVGQTLENLVTECMEYLEAMSLAEVASLVDSMQPVLKMILDFDPTQPLDGHARERVAIYYLAGVVQEGYISFHDALFPDPRDNEVLRVYPELVNKMDEDGLLLLDAEFQPMDMGVLYRDHMLHYHQCLRRGFSSNPNFDFLGRFLRYRQDNPNCEFRVAVDLNRIMRREFVEHICELDTWFGPRFDREHLDDPYAVGLTVIKRRKPSPFEIGEGELDRTEFFWSYKDGVKTFEAEEISTPNHKFGSFFINRYVHAERDVSAARLRHFDGAVKVYCEDTYANRFEKYMPNEPRSFAKPKLFRVDGDIDLDHWIELTAHFFKGNEMLIEYFDPDQFEKRFGLKIAKWAEIDRKTE